VGDVCSTCASARLGNARYHKPYWDVDTPAPEMFKTQKTVDWDEVFGPDGEAKRRVRGSVAMLHRCKLVFVDPVTYCALRDV
jgi:hypothetical protein